MVADRRCSGGAGEHRRAVHQQRPHAMRLSRRRCTGAAVCVCASSRRASSSCALAAALRDVSEPQAMYDCGCTCASSMRASFSCALAAAICDASDMSHMGHLRRRMVVRAVGVASVDCWQRARFMATREGAAGGCERECLYVLPLGVNDIASMCGGRWDTRRRRRRMRDRLCVLHGRSEYDGLWPVV